MPKILSGPTVKRSVIVEVDVYERMLQHLGGSPGAFNDYIRRRMRQDVAAMDAKAVRQLPSDTQEFLNNLMEG
jgi:hypothetical protein